MTGAAGILSGFPSKPMPTFCGRPNAIKICSVCEQRICKVSQAKTSCTGDGAWPVHGEGGLQMPCTCHRCPPRQCPRSARKGLQTPCFSVTQISGRNLLRNSLYQLRPACGRMSHVEIDARWVTAGEVDTCRVACAASLSGDPCILC